MALEKFVFGSGLKGGGWGGKLQDPTKMVPLPTAPARAMRLVRRTGLETRQGQISEAAEQSARVASIGLESLSQTRQMRDVGL